MAIAEAQKFRTWYIRSWHTKGEFDISSDGEINLMGWVVFPKEEHVTLSQVDDIWRPITGPGTVCFSSILLKKKFQIQKWSAAINIALSAEQQRTSLPYIDRGTQRPIIKSPHTVMRQKYLTVHLCLWSMISPLGMIISRMLMCEVLTMETKCCGWGLNANMNLVTQSSSRARNEIWKTC